MSAFPTSPAPQLPFTRLVEFDNATVRMESGVEYSRYYNSGVAFYGWELNYSILTETELGTLRTFYRSVGTWDTFDFTDPDTSTTHTCRFDGPFEVTYQGHNQHSLTLKIRKVTA